MSLLFNPGLKNCEVSLLQDFSEPVKYYSEKVVSWAQGGMPCAGQGVAYSWGLVLGISASRCPGLGWKEPTYSQLLLLGQKVVVLIPLIHGDQDVLEPIPHAQGEFGQLRIQAGGDI